MPQWKSRTGRRDHGTAIAARESRGWWERHEVTESVAQGNSRSVPIRNSGTHPAHRQGNGRPKCYLECYLGEEKRGQRKPASSLTP